MQRATRCRTTALPTFLLTIIPSRGPPHRATSLRVESGHAGATSSRWMSRSRVRVRMPCERVRRKSDRRWIRCAEFIVERASRDRRRNALVSGGAPATTKQGRNSGAQLCAALGAAAADDRPAGTGPHAETEAVLARTTTVVRLESPLALGHRSDSFKSVPTRAGCKQVSVSSSGAEVSRIVWPTVGVTHQVSDRKSARRM